MGRFFTVVERLKKWWGKVSQSWKSSKSDGENFYAVFFFPELLGRFFRPWKFSKSLWQNFHDRFFVQKIVGKFFTIVFYFPKLLRGFPRLFFVSQRLGESFHNRFLLPKVSARQSTPLKSFKKWRGKFAIYPKQLPHLVPQKGYSSFWAVLMLRFRFWYDTREMADCLVICL